MLDCSGTCAENMSLSTVAVVDTEGSNDRTILCSEDIKNMLNNRRHIRDKQQGKGS